MEKKPGCLGYKLYKYRGLQYTTRLYTGSIINHYKDPHSLTTIMESRRLFFRGSG